MFRQKVQTLNQFIVEKQAEHPGAKGDLSRLLHHVGIAAKIVNRAVNKAGLVDILGRSGIENVQGEEQQKLDVFADITFINEMKVSGEVAAVATEEREEIIVFDDRLSRNAKYVFCMDPLDGSSNIDVNASVGTIFSIYERKTKRGELADKEDFLRKGTEQIAAGYVVYGSSTMLVYTTGMGVYGFTLDPSIGEFCLSHPNIKTPDVGTIYSINESNYSKFPDGVKQFMKYLQAQNTGDKRLYTSRYIGTLVADFHRNLLKGGIFLYPQTSANPNGKLRLSYECNPMAFIAEQAGGKAGDGKGRILDIVPNKIHQRVVFYTGSPCMMDKLNEYLQKYS